MTNDSIEGVNVDLDDGVSPLYADLSAGVSPLYAFRFRPGKAETVHAILERCGYAVDGNFYSVECECTRCKEGEFCTGIYTPGHVLDKSVLAKMCSEHDISISRWL